jgi:alpha-1,6-mannosyltransferase
VRVLDLTTLYLEGAESGVNTYLQEKARYFSTRPDIEHVLILPGAKTEQQQLFDSRLHTIRSPRLPSNPEHRVLTGFGEVRRLLREERPTVVEVDCAYLLGKVANKALASQDVPIVGFYHVHLPTFIARPSASRFSRRLASVAESCAWRYVDYCYQHVDRLVVASTDLRARLAERGFDRLDVVPLGVNVDLFQPPSTRERVGPTTILYVGRLSLEKKVDVLIEAFKRISQRGHYRLQIAGGGPYAKRLERVAGGYPGIEFLGKQAHGPELAALYAQADIFANPSPNETFSLTTLEGMSADLPAVVIDQGGPRDLIPPGLGELAAPDDVDDFAAKLEHVAQHLDDYTGRCRAHVLEHYTWARTFERLLEVYEQARAERAKRPA